MIAMARLSLASPFTPRSAAASAAKARRRRRAVDVCALVVGGVGAEGGVFTFGGVVEVDVEDPGPGDGVSGLRALGVLEVGSVEQGLLGSRRAGGD